jgi:hypothetical protein
MSIETKMAEKEIDKVQHQTHKGCIEIDDAIRIAKEYAEEQLQLIADKFGKDCSHCGNQGWTAEHGCDGSGDNCDGCCPIQVRCQSCYEEPLSKFNILNTLLTTDKDGE